MLSAIAVNAAGYPGEGFFKLAQRLGLLADETPESATAFLATEQSRPGDPGQTLTDAPGRV